MANKVFVCDPDLRDGSSEIAAIWGVGPGDIVEAESVEDIVDVIKKNRKLDELILRYHAFTGGIMIDNEGYSLDEAKLLDRFKGLGAKIGHIRFEGCWVGKGPNEMAAFGKVFQATYVSGFTWVSWSSSGPVKVPRGSTEKSLQKLLANYEKWLMPGTPGIQQMVGLARNADYNATLQLLWYQPDLTRQPPYENDNFKKLGSHTFHSRGEATKRTVAAGAKSTAGGAPVVPFEYVTVKL